MNLTAALYDRLAGDTILAELLAEYRGGLAIFTSDPIPGDARLPAIVMSGPEQDDPYEAKNEAGRRVRWRFRIYDDATGSAALLEDITLRVRALLHRDPPDLDDGWHCYSAEMSGPTVAPTDENLQGRALVGEFLLAHP